MSNPWYQSNQFQNLRAIFANAGFNIWLVGGACRDFLRGDDPKDMDFATDATPDEQVALYEKVGVRFIPTGLQHGTVTVLMNDEPFEITSLRIDAETDGRHATVEFTRDIVQDLARRDLTVNAMAQDFDGVVIDPFNGIDDLFAGRVRFVGDAEERMREDYLRILRFFRFHARIAGEGPLCDEAVAAIRRTRGGLGQISVERIWMEMSKIITGPAATATVRRMRELALFEIIGMPVGVETALTAAVERGVTDPATVMGWFIVGDGKTNPINGVAADWKWSVDERARASFVFQNRDVADLDTAKNLLVDGNPLDWVTDVLRLNNVDPTPLVDWDVPKLPVTGRDLLAAGMKPSPEMGEVLRQMTDDWKASGFTLTRDQLMGRVNG